MINSLKFPQFVIVPLAPHPSFEFVTSRRFKSFRGAAERLLPSWHVGIELFPVVCSLQRGWQALSSPLCFFALQVPSQPSLSLVISIPQLPQVLMQLQGERRGGRYRIVWRIPDHRLHQGAVIGAVVDRHHPWEGRAGILLASSLNLAGKIRGRC